MAELIGLVACCGKKMQTPGRARDVYQSALFKKSLNYLERAGCDAIFVLSAKYGLVTLDEQISPYNVTLNGMAIEDRIAWGGGVVRSLPRASGYLVCAGNRYREFVVPALERFAVVEVPMQGMGIGEQLSWLTARAV